MHPRRAGVSPPFHLWAACPLTEGAYDVVEVSEASETGNESTLRSNPGERGYGSPSASLTAPRSTPIFWADFTTCPCNELDSCTRLFSVTTSVTSTACLYRPTLPSMASQSLKPSINGTSVALCLALTELTLLGFGLGRYRFWLTLTRARLYFKGHCAIVCFMTCFQRHFGGIGPRRGRPCRIYQFEPLQAGSKSRELTAYNLSLGELAI